MRYAVCPRHLVPIQHWGICLSEEIHKPFALSRAFLLSCGGKSVLLVKEKASSRSGFLLSMHVVLKTRHVNIRATYVAPTYQPLVRNFYPYAEQQPHIGAPADQYRCTPPLRGKGIPARGLLICSLRRAKLGNILCLAYHSTSRPKPHTHRSAKSSRGAAESDDSAAPRYLKGSAMRANLSCLRYSYPSRERGPLEVFSFFEVFEICISRELDAEVQWRRAQLKAVDRRGFVVKLVRGCIHTSQ